MSDTATGLDTPPVTPHVAARPPRTALANVNLFVGDPERSRRFYVEALDLTDDARSAPPHFVLLDAGRGCTLTLQAAGPLGESLDQLGGVELGFELVDATAGTGPTTPAAARALDAARARVVAAGGTAAEVAMMGWAHGFDGRDPDGHRLSVFVRSAEGRPAAGDSVRA